MTLENFFKETTLPDNLKINFWPTIWLSIIR